MPRTRIDNILPQKATGETAEFITCLWEAFHENYDEYEAGGMPVEDEINYRILSSPGPCQYKAFSEFFAFFKDKDKQIWALRDYMYMHDFADIKDGTTKAPILDVLQKLYDVNDYEPKKITYVSGLFWGQHPETRNEIMSYFKKFHDRGDKLRIFTRAKRDVIGKDSSIFSGDSQFYMGKRIPFHYVRAGDTYLYFEFPHTESSVFRLNMLLDLDALEYKQGTKTGLLGFLDSVIEGAKKLPDKKGEKKEFVYVRAGTNTEYPYFEVNIKSTGVKVTPCDEFQAV